MDALNGMGNLVGRDGVRLLKVRQGGNTRIYLKFNGEDRLQLAWDCDDAVRMIAASLSGLTVGGRPLDLAIVHGPTANRVFSDDVALQMNQFTDESGKPLRLSAVPIMEALTAQ
ncbi:MAG: hypothetical protein HYV15_04835, partial [Elusimicrobia bacterium]|nr:hypothetical protein [Elusimicrobiota bacterium]